MRHVTPRVWSTPGEQAIQVRDVLKTKGGRLVTIGPTAMAREAVAPMVEHNIGSLPVLEDDGGLIGFVGERDLIRAVDQGRGRFEDVSIRALRTPDPVTCDSENEVEVVMGQMSRRRIAKVPVLDAGRLVGIVSVGEVV